MNWDSPVSALSGWRREVVVLVACIDESLQWRGVRLSRPKVFPFVISSVCFLALVVVRIGKREGQPGDYHIAPPAHPICNCSLILRQSEILGNLIFSNTVQNRF
jgi:hypothetical protein